ncbi:MAG: PCYCGC motif-containing (lipo)protein [Candidatus Hydrothermarchaeales archaeon]
MKPEDSPKGPDKSENKTSSRISKTYIVGLIVILIIGGGLVYSSITNRGEGKKSSKTADVDPQQYLINELLISSSFSGFPDYAFTSEKTQAGYLVATRIPDALERIPCYCSCGAIGHKSLKDCFTKDDGGFADHASYCDLCVEEALDVYGMQKDGLPIGEIRSRIDEKYSRYGEPTDTPPIS